MTVRYDQMALGCLTIAQLPRSKSNVISLVAWWCGENNSTDINTKAKWNPGDTEEPMPGATDFNAAGVKNYTSMLDGLNAWNKTLHNGRYPAIIHCLTQSAEPQVTLEAIAGTPWGYAVDKTILPTILDNWEHYASLPVGGSEGTNVTINSGTSETTGADTTQPVIPPPPAHHTSEGKSDITQATPVAPIEESKEVEATADVNEGTNVLSALQTQLASFIDTHKQVNSAIAAKIRTHISELEAIATELEGLI